MHDPAGVTPAVVSAAVNVICELAAKNPQNYLPLAPQLFKLLTTSNNNWIWSLPVPASFDCVLTERMESPERSCRPKLPP